MKDFLSTFSAAPHRMYFFFGGLSLVTSMCWWMLHLFSTLIMPEQLAAYLPTYSLPPNQLHGVLMVFGLFTFFILGFLSTTFPRWMNTDSVAKSTYAPSAYLLISGYVLMLFGATQEQVWLLGTVLFTLGWGLGIFGLLRVFIATAKRISHGWMCLLGNIAGCGIFVLTALSIAFQPELLNNEFINPNRLIHFAIWWFLVPVFFSVCHRMVPFFTKAVVPGYEVIRPEWTLWVMGVSSVLHPLLSFAELAWLTDLTMLASAFYLSMKWKPVQFPDNPLMTSLHMGFFWLSISMGLFLVQDILDFMQLHGVISFTWIGEAPLHALTIGFLTSMLVAMATRVTQGHSGGKLMMNHLTWLLFIGLQMVALVRVLLELPMFSSMRSTLLLVAALGWIALTLLWFFQYGPKYLKARSDGSPG